MLPRWALMGVCVLGPALVAGAQEAGKAVLEVDAPAGAEVTIDGNAYGARRRIEFGPFPEGAVGRYMLTCRRPGEPETPARPIVLKSGWRVRVPLTGADAARPELVVQSGHTRAVNAIAYSPDGRLVATGSADETVLLWDAQTGQQLRRLVGHTGGIESMAFRPDGRLLATGSSSEDATISLWDPVTGTRRVLEGHTWAVTGVAFSRDGRTLVSGSRDGTVAVWDVATAKRLGVSEPLGKEIRCLAMSGDGGTLALGCEDGTVRMWDVGTGRETRKVAVSDQAVVAVVFGRDGAWSATLANDQTLAFWDGSLTRCDGRFPEDEREVYGLALSPDGKVLAACGRGGVGLWDPVERRLLERIDKMSGIPFSAGFSPDGRSLAVGMGDASVVWDLAGHKARRELVTRGLPVERVRFTPDGRRLVALLLGYHDSAATWDLGRGGLLNCVEYKEASHGLGLSADGSRVLLDGYDNTAVVSGTARGGPPAVFSGHTESVEAAAFSGDGRRMATSGWDKAIVVWDVESRAKLMRVEPGARCEAVALNGDGSRLAACSDLGTMVWSVPDGRRLRVLYPNENSRSTVAFSPDGQQLAVGYVHTQLWDLTREEPARNVESVESVTVVTFSLDGRWLGVGSHDEGITVSDVRTGAILQRFTGHYGGVHDVHFSPDGRWLASAGDDGTARLWDVATGDELGRIVVDDQGEWLAVTAEGLFDGSDGGRELVSYRVGNGLQVVPADRFFQDFYRSGLLARLAAGERPRPEAEFASRRAPVVRIVEPAGDGVAEGSPVRLTVEVEDQGGGVQGPWIWHNGARVKLEAVPGTRNVGRDTAVRRTYDVLLVEGENQIEVRAASGEGSWESEPARLKLSYTKPVGDARLGMLAIGISRYELGNLRLEYADDDARAMAGLFRRRAKALYDDRVEVTELIDGAATTEAIKGSIRGLAEASRPQDTLIVFLSGHGTMVGQRYYFIPANFRMAPGEALEEAVRTGGVPIDVLADALTAGQALRRMLIVDSCASGGAVELFQVATRDPFAFQGEIERLGRNEGVFVLSASAASEAAREFPALGHGVLTYTLLAGLGDVTGGPLERVAVRPASGEVADVLEWFGFAASQVPRLTKQLCGQEQNVHTSGKGASFPLLPVREL